jgi:hypothetical protein
LGKASMRPWPLAAGFQFSRPGKVSRAAKSGCSAEARRETESAMPLEVSNLTKSRREVLTKPPPLLGACVRTGPLLATAFRFSVKTAYLVCSRYHPHPPDKLVKEAPDQWLTESPPPALPHSARWLTC